MSDDFSSLPADVTIPANLTADVPQDQLDTIQMIPFPFCVLFNGNPAGSIVVAAPSPELAATTIDQFVQLLNTTLQQRGYPANCCTWRSGSC